MCIFSSLGPENYSSRATESQASNVDLPGLGDEAHERSLNIDVILGLLARLIPRHPHLKVIIASATINKEKFKQFVDKHLPKGMRCEIVELSGKLANANAGYQRYFRDSALQQPYLFSL